VEGAVSYELYKNTAETIPTAPDQTLTATAATITGLNNGTAYYVWVKAKDSGGAVAVSQRARARLPLLTIPFTGYYKSSGYAGVPYDDDGFEIKDRNFYYYNNSGMSIGYAGTIVDHLPASGDSGVLIIQITDSGSWGKTQNNYYGIAYKDLTAGSLSQSSAVGTYGDVPTLDQARTEYAQAGYYGYYGVYTKQDTVDLGPLAGRWKSDLLDLETDGYEYWVIIGGNSFTAYYDTTGDGIIDFYTDYDEAEFAGTIVEITDPTASEGFIYIKLTNVSYLSAGSVGDFWAVHWKDKNGDAVKFATPGDGDDPKPDLNSAKTAYTDLDDFDGYYNDFEKQ
jgi:hypothetical protein